MKRTRRQHLESEPENHERWLVSYADFITLLFAFFVVMFASSQTDAAKIRALSRSVSDAFKGAAADEAAYKSELMKSSEALHQALAKEIASGEISVSMKGRGLVVSLQEATFFPSGSDILLPGAMPSLNKIASIIGKLPNPIRLEGHTDSIPIRNSRFRNNWELAAARGVAVLQSFHAQHAIPSGRLAVVSYADTVPMASNDSLQGRAVNRRVDITILNESASREEATGAGVGQKSAVKQEQRGI